MQLITMLLGIVSVLTLMSGLIVFAGAKKKERTRSAWFFLASIFATTWMVAITMFITATPAQASTVDWHAQWAFVSAMLIDVAFLGYVAWHEKYGKIITTMFLIAGLIIGAMILVRTDLIYNEVIIANTGNSIDLVVGPLFISYGAFFGAIVPVIVLTLLKQYLKSRSDRKRNGDLVIMISFGISSIIVLITNTILPFMGNWHLSWLGPLSLSVTIIAFYYTILRYRSLNLASLWLRIFSYTVLLTSVAIVYMVIFSLIFAALFKGSTPSTEVIVLNFIMILIFLALMPAINELSVYIRKLISGQK